MHFMCSLFSRRFGCDLENGNNFRNKITAPHYVLIANYVFDILSGSNNIENKKKIDSLFKYIFTIIGIMS